MAARTLAPTDYSSPVIVSADAQASGVSWPAVFAGGTIIAALALLLIALGVGFGLTAVSPWAGAGASAATLGAAAIAWLVVTQIISSSMGGYIAGRLRTKWVALHTDEVYFRDTAHGFLSWGLAWIGAAALLASATAMLAGAPPAAPDRTSTRAADADRYYVDALFRPGGTGTVPDATWAEAMTVLGRVLAAHGDPSADQRYLAHLVAITTNVDDAAAATHVNEVVTEARTDLDAMRKTGARASFWLFISLLAGAYCASHAATIGGRHRDHLASR